ncbi:hypothetical protein ACHAXR_011846 [Thalassiosira sp. AJA248-18]
MMGGSCSRHQDHPDDGNNQERPRQRRCTEVSRRGRLRSRSFSSAVGRLCGGGSLGGSSDDESILSTKGSTKRAARHSVDAEVPNQSIAHLYPTDDNYEQHPTNPSLRCPKSLTDLCIDTICRSLPNLEGELPPGLPQDIVDRLVSSLTSHAALNSTTLRALSKCELGSLCLANCRGVSDEWLIPLSSNSMSSCSGMNQRLRSSSTASYDCHKAASNFNHEGYLSVPSSPHPPLRDVHPTQFAVPYLDVRSSSSMMMELDDCGDLNSAPSDHHLHHPFPLSSEAHQDRQSQRLDNNMEDCCAKSLESRSTSSFVSASSTPYAGGGGEDGGHPSPILPSVLPPPEFFSLKWSPAPSSSLWLYPMRGSALADGNNNMLTLPLSPQKPPPQPSSLPVRTGNGGGANRNALDTDNTMYSDETSYANSYLAASTASSTTSTLTLLDLRGSQRLTDRGLLQLSHTPLRSLEVAKLDNCHGITGRGLIAFSRSHRLHTLSLANCRRLTDEAVVNVSHLGSSLMALNLDGCRCLTDLSLEALSGLIGLRKLDLSQCDLITDDGLVSLNDLELIEELSLGWCRLISDDGLDILSGQPNRSQALRTLRLARCSITDAGLEHLEKLEHLEELDMNGCINVSSVALGDTLEKLIHLTSLDVSYCPGILHSSWQGKINCLKSLECCYSRVRDSHLARLKNLPMLEELNLDSCLVANWGIAHLIDNNVMPNLTTLDLADTDISDAAMSKIAQFKHMRHLSLFYCNISNRGLRHLSSMKNLEVLNLDSREIGDEGCKYIRSLPLKTLDLFSSRVTDLGCVFLSKIKTLTSLELCGGGIGDLGCAHLATISNLTSLNLSQNESITNRGAASLAALTNLKALNLSNTHVNSDALKYFGGLLKLQSLALYGCNMENSSRLNSLHSELPSLRCIRLNSASNEDGVIDTNIESEEDGDDGVYYAEEDDEDQLDSTSGLSDILHNNGDNSVGSSEEGSMSDFQDANEVQSVDTSQGRNMDHEI